MHLGVRKAIYLWQDHKNGKVDKNKRVENDIIYYQDKAICRWNKDGTFSINTCGYAKSKSTRGFINNILLTVYGNGAPYLKYNKKNDTVYMYHVVSGEINEWFENINGDGWFNFTDKNEYII